MVLARLAKQLVAMGAVRPQPRVVLALAAGKIAGGTDRIGLKKHMTRNRWQLFEGCWVTEQLALAADAAYENDVAHVVAKLLVRNREIFAKSSPNTR